MICCRVVVRDDCWLSFFADIRKRIELIQDFEMPTVSQCVEVSPDGQFIYVAGNVIDVFKC